jgi:hypothetical protein
VKGKTRTKIVELTEPTDDARYWREREADNWLNSFGYSVVKFWGNLTPIQAVLLAKLPTLDGKQSYSGLAEMMGLNWRTCKAQLNELLTRWHIELTQIRGGYFIVEHVGAERDVADVAEDVADVAEDVADAARDVADLQVTTSTISTNTLLAPAFLEEEKEAAQETTNMDTVNNQGEGQPEWWRRLSKAEKEDIAYRKHLRNIGCSERSIPTILALWKEKMRRVEGPEAFCLILSYSKDYLAEKNAQNPSGYIIAELKDHLGIKRRKPPKPKPRKQLTPEEQARRQFWAEMKRMEREDAALCVDT